MKAFPPKERHGVYRAIASRRQVHVFRPDPIPPSVIERVLCAAQHEDLQRRGARCKLILVEDAMTRERAYSVLTEQRDREHARLGFALELVRQSPLHLCITFTPLRSGTNLRAHDLLRDLFGICGAVQNLYLAARAEGLGVAWIEVPLPDSLRRILGIPVAVLPLAYLCLGYPGGSADACEIEPTMNLEKAIYVNGWGMRDGGASLLRRLHDRRAFPLERVHRGAAWRVDS